MARLSGFSELYEIRKDLAISRQPRHMPLVRELDSALEDVGADHPYSLDLEQLRLITKKQPDWSTGSRGLLAEVPKGVFLYRLCSVRKLLSCTTEVLPRYPKLEKEGNDDENFRVFKRDFDLAKTWLPYERYAGGYHWGYRGFTWWTTLDLLSGSPVCNAHKIGIPNDWIPSNAVVLRCLSDSVAEGFVKVPTVVDAFDSAIFHPTSDSDNPGRGVTISLEAGDRLLPGADEFVLGEIQTDKLALCPLYIDKDMTSKHEIELSRVLLTLLLNYYKELAG